MSAGFEIEDGVLTKYTGDETEVVIPEGVVTIGKNAFYENKKITEIVMPDSVIKIDSNAFEKCAKLNYVPGGAIKKEVKAAMSNSFGFGGQNSSVVFTRYE